MIIDNLLEIASEEHISIFANYYRFALKENDENV